MVGKLFIVRKSNKSESFTLQFLSHASIFYLVSYWERNIELYWIWMNIC